MLSKDDILNADDRPIVDVDVPEWGGSVKLRAMSAAQRDQYEQAMYESSKGKTLDNVRAALVAYCLVDDEGKSMFTPKEVKELGEKGAAAISRLFDVAQQLNRMTDESIEELKGN